MENSTGMFHSPKWNTTQTFTPLRAQMRFQHFLASRAAKKEGIRSRAIQGLP